MMEYHDAVAAALTAMLHNVEAIMIGLAVLGLMGWVYRLMREL